MVYKYLCLECNGKRKVQNPNFEACLNEDNDWEKLKGNPCNKSCPAYNMCNEGEETNCGECDGKGYLIINDKQWKRIS